MIINRKTFQLKPILVAIIVTLSVTTCVFVSVYLYLDVHPRSIYLNHPHYSNFSRKNEEIGVKIEKENRIRKLKNFIRRITFQKQEYTFPNKNPENNLRVITETSIAIAKKTGKFVIEPTDIENFYGSSGFSLFIPGNRENYADIFPIVLKSSGYISLKTIDGVTHQQSYTLE